MTSLIERIREIFQPSAPEPLKAGFITYHTPADQADQYRLHLRVENDGEGLMIVNASSVLHLNRTATEFAWHLMHGETIHEASKKMARRFDAPSTQLEEDLRQFQEKIHLFITQPDQDPTADLGFEPHELNGDISAPFRLDCCLTYRQEEAAQKPTEAEGELDSTAWKAIISKAYNAGIPHLVFLGGEATQREDLIALLSEAETLGLVTGLVSSGSRLEDVAFVQQMITSGLDHLIFRLDPANEAQIQTLLRILPLDLFTCVDISVSEGFPLRDLINQLKSAGANAFALHPAQGSTENTLVEALAALTEAEVKIIHDNPQPLVSPALLKAAGEAGNQVSPYARLLILPDGTVLPGNGAGAPLGNLATEAWEAVWNRREFLAL